jgi:tetratricopeptide (TPR) repeat protein
MKTKRGANVFHNVLATRLDLGRWLGPPALFGALLCSFLIATPANALPKGCVGGAALMKAGSLDEATKAYNDYLSQNPTRTACAVNALQKIKRIEARHDLAVASVLHKQGIDDDAASDVKAALEANPKIDVPANLRGLTSAWWRSPLRWTLLILAAIVAALLLWRIGWSIGRRIAKTVMLGDFSGPDSDGDGAKAAKVLGPMISSSMHRLGNEVGGHHVDLVNGTIEDFAVPAALTDVSPELKILGSILSTIQALLPAGNRRTITGTVLERGDHGTGLSLAVARGSRVREETVLWEETYFPKIPTSETAPTSYYKLVAPAAVWALYNLNGSSSGVTKDWFSYALFAVGAAAQEDGDMASASRLYQRALGRDESNVAALYNQAVLDLQEGDTHIAERRLNVIRSTFGNTLVVDNPISYRTEYKLATLALANRKDLSHVVATVRHLTLMTAKQLQSRKVRKNTGLKGFLEEFELSAIVLLAGVLLAKGERDRGIRITDRPALIRALEMDEAEGPGSDDLVTYVENRSALPYRAHYNLACYWAEAEEWEKVFAELHIALEARDATLNRWVLKDPSFRNLKRDTTRRERLEHLVKMFA